MVGRADGVSLGFKQASIIFRPNAQNATSLEIEFAGAHTEKPVGVDLQPSQTNYFLGKDSSAWRTHVANYGRVLYRDLYPGISAVFYGNGDHLEHDFVVSPGADYRQIRMHLSNKAKPHIAQDGALEIAAGGGSLRMEKPVAYQEKNGERQIKSGSFRVFPNGDIGFSVADYDRTQSLIIDPVLSFSTYLTSIPSTANLIATDASGNNYVYGSAALGFPVTPNAFPGCPACATGAIIAFVSKLSPDGSSLIYSTVFGPGAEPSGLAVDASGNVLLAGWGVGAAFPTKSGQPTNTTNNDTNGYLLSLSADGSSLNYSTLVGSSLSADPAASTSVSALAIDSSGNAYVTGITGNGFSTTPGALNQGNSSEFTFNVFLSKFSPAGKLLYAAVLGDADPPNGGGGPIGAYALAVDAAGDAYVSGQAGSLWPITQNAYLSQIPGPYPSQTPFVTKVAPDGGSLLYSTYLDYENLVSGVAVLANGDVLVAASTAFAGGVLWELDSTGSHLVYARPIGDASYMLNGMALDPDGDIWLAGETSDPAFPLLTPLQSTFPYVVSAIPEPASVLSQYDPTGQTLKFSTFLGGPSIGYASSVAVDADHRAHVSGAVGYGMYTTPGALVPALPASDATYGTTWAYVALVDPQPAPALCVSPNTVLNFGSVPVGSSMNQAVSVTSCGTQPLTISGASTANPVFTVPATGNSCTQSLPVGQSCSFQVRYSPTAGGTDSSALTIQSNASVPNAVLAITGIGAVPVIYVGPPPIFENTLVGHTSAPQPLGIGNEGLAPLVINTAKTSISGDFSITNLAACESPIPYLSGCPLLIAFTPTASGVRTGQLSIVTNDPATPVTVVPLQGAGAAAPLQFVPIAPCRIADTRNAPGPFGGPAIGGMQTRDFPIPQSACGLPATVAAYALNVTVVPNGPLNYLTVWPAGTTQPLVSLLNSTDGRVKANAAIVPAGAAGAISIYAQSQTTTNVILDISGYFVPATGSSLEFFPLSPCRIADTRKTAGPLGGPSLAGGQSRAFPVQSSDCQVPTTAQAYSLNITAIPTGDLNYLTVWPTGQSQPGVSTLNAATGAVTANAAIVPAGTHGEVSVFATNETHFVMDVNGYFAAPAAGGTSFNTTAPCRILDTRQLSTTPFPGTYSLNLASSPCNLPSSATALVLNATVVPKASLGYLTLWPAETTQPFVSTLNALDGFIASNMAVVTTNNQGIDAYATDNTQLILDVSGYFAP